MGTAIIAIAFAIVVVLEYLTPSEYVFGYLYTGTTLLADSRLNRGAVLGITLAATGLTLLDLLQKCFLQEGGKG
ncbi:hypothetical protein [Nostoc flagelliforme]|uniref:hypothetical protein n=1 Tax=Nostoc flagelliforme TaxID=1306274 RepID=UPI001F5526C4|nr:hypothetical protein [Nostoc flagelliforme]